ncbi:MAG: DUF5788 family protein [Halobacteriaceae archaeon]
MKPFERKQLLERVEREGATVGMSIPDEITVDDEPFRLQEFVFETKRVEDIDPEHRDRVDDVVSVLRRERLARKQRLEEEALPYEAGEQLAQEILGIDRALTALESLEGADIEDEAARSEAADQRRWVRFLKRALGQADTGGDTAPGTGR